MTAPKVLDTISRIPGCPGQASDAVSAETQVKFKDAPELLRLPEEDYPFIWIRLPINQMPEKLRYNRSPSRPIRTDLL